MNEELWNKKLSQFINTISKDELKEIVWNFTLLRFDENFKNGIEGLKEELKLIRKNKR